MYRTMGSKDNGDDVGSKPSRKENVGTGVRTKWDVHDTRDLLLTVAIACLLRVAPCALNRLMPVLAPCDSKALYSPWPCTKALGNVY